jgi:hypothetical protein
MKLRYLVPAALLVAAAGCDSVLDVKPFTQVDEGTAVNTPSKARAAMAGLYDALQSGSYYGGSFVFLPELSSDNAAHTGTFTTYADADRARMTPDNTTVEGMWDSMYSTIGRANVIIERVPAIATLDPAERDDMLGQAYAIRALVYHDLVKIWGSPAGGVPIRLVPPETPAEASNITRSSVADVYTQINADLDAAQTKITNTARSRATVAFVRALRSRVKLYQGQYTSARDEAAAVIAASGYSLAPTFGALFTATGTATSEDILRLAFTDVEFMNLGFYYLRKNLGGRYEQAPTADLFNAYETGDGRRAITVPLSGTFRYSLKWPTPIGAEDYHVIRLAEVILNKAEAHARLNELGLAVTEYNKVRVRAGLPAHVLGVNVTTQAEVLTAVLRERRSELALEADRWPDLRRRSSGCPTSGTTLTAAEAATCLIGSVMIAHRASFGATNLFPLHLINYPIPQNELDVTPGLTQNLGY